MPEKIISEDLQKKMQPGAVVNVFIVANLPKNLEAELAMISSTDLELRKSFLDYRRLQATSQLAVYFDENGIPYKRIRITPGVNAELPVDIIQYLAYNSAQFNIQNINYNGEYQVL